jgi:uncharacterized protein CbrC (UPF0167 family)
MPDSSIASGWSRDREANSLVAARHQIIWLHRMLRDVLVQACPEDHGFIHSGWIGIYADAIRYLGTVGVLEIVNDVSDRNIYAKELKD